MGVLGNFRIGVIEVLKVERQVVHGDFRVQSEGLLVILQRARAPEEEASVRVKDTFVHVAEQQVWCLFLGLRDVAWDDEFGLALDDGVVTDDGLN
jgi:hypothetical protein